MSMPKCKTCRFYQPFPLVKNEGECGDTAKVIFVQDLPQHDKPPVFDFSWCTNHETASDK